MRFLIPAQTFSEYQHRRMPVYETLAAIGATTIVGSLTVGGLAAAGATAGAGALAAYGVNKALGSGGSGGSAPSFDPYQSLELQKMQFNQMSPQALQFGKDAYNQASQEGINFANRGTAANIANQNKVTPGSSQQRQLAQNQINQYIQGQIPQDVQQKINRQVAQNLGGGFNLFNGGGQAPQNFARNIGQTSLGLSQFGLSAAPTWQQLANSMVVSPSVGLEAGLQGIRQGVGLSSSAAGIGNDLSQSQYQSELNQYKLQQFQNQQNQQLGMQLGQMGLQGYEAMNKANYYGNLSQSAQGRLATVGAIPAYTNTPYLNSRGYSAGETPSFGTGY